MRILSRAVIWKDTQLRQMEIKTTVRKNPTRFYFIPNRLSKFGKSASGTKGNENTLDDRSETVTTVLKNTLYF